MPAIKAVKLDKKEVFQIDVNNDNYIVVKELLLKERLKIIDKLKKYKSAGFIGSIQYPRNKQMQSVLDDLTKKKKTLKESIEKINKIFLK